LTLILASLFLVIAGGLYYLKTHRLEVQEILGRRFGAMPGFSRLNMNWSKGSKKLTYWIKMKYPATSIIRFYEERAKAMGHMPIGERMEGNSRQWIPVHGVDPVTGSRHYVHQYQAAWTHPKKQRVIFLTLVYQSLIPSSVPSQDEPTVDLFVAVDEKPAFQGRVGIPG
jgi:hypothetical protein